MSRLAARPLSALRRFARARQGATAVEFALISIPLMLLMFGVLELGIVLLVTATLETATDFAARNIRTGVFQTSGNVTKEQFHGLVCRNMNWLKADCLGTANLTVETQTFATFSETGGGSAPADPTMFDPTETCWSPGTAGDVVLVRTYYKWPIVTPLLKPMFVNDGHGGRLISSTRTFRNEPFNADDPEGAKC
jgi:Flp pilus assembly protein TadG